MQSNNQAAPPSPAPPPKPDKPTEAQVLEATIQEKNPDYKHISGIRGKKGVNDILQSDDPSFPGIAIQTTGDIYLNADYHMQLHSDTCVRHVAYWRTEYAANVTSTIAQTNTSTIGGDNSCHINGNHTLVVVETCTERYKNHKLEAQAQDIAVANNQNVGVYGDQSISVKGKQTNTVTGDLLTLVDGNIVETVKSNETRNVTGDVAKTVGGKHDFVKNGSDASLTIGAKIQTDISLAEKLSIGGSFEQTFALKRIYNNSIVKEVTAGVKMGTNNTVNLVKTKTTTKEQSAIIDRATQMFKHKTKMWKLGAKISMFD